MVSRLAFLSYAAMVSLVGVERVNAIVTMLNFILLLGFQLNSHLVNISFRLGEGVQLGMAVMALPPMLQCLS